MQSDVPLTKSQEQARRQVERFIRRFEPSYRQLAYYAALPLVLTPELLHYLRNQFLRQIQLPWVAEADLLLSDLCYPVGYEQYALDTDVRAYLVAEMEDELGVDRLQAVAKLLLRYIQHLDMMNPYLSRQDLQAQQWAAMVYVDDRQRQQVARQVAEAYQRNSSANAAHGLTSLDPAEMAWLSRLVEELAPKLEADQYKPLLDYARLVGQLITDPKQASSDAIARSYVVEGITLEVPEELIPPEEKQSRVSLKKFPELEPFDFIDAQLADDTDDLPFPPMLQTEEYTVITFQEEIEPELTQELEAFGFTVATLQRGSDKTKTIDGWVIQEEQHQAYKFNETLTEDVILEMVAIPEGKFLMGSPEDEPGSDDDESPQHEVTLQPFFMGRYPITQAQWRAVAEMKQVKQELNPDPSHFKGENRPVEQVSWEDAVEFCARLSRETDRIYRLPSEAEWEYACRAGTTTPFHFGEMILTEVANYNGRAYGDGPKGEDRGETTPVMEFGIANQYGLSEMHGNVWEWCQDHWHGNYEGAPSDGSAWVDKDNENENRSHICRGGSWICYPDLCRSAFRVDFGPDFSFYDLGFRVVCSAPRSS